MKAATDAQVMRLRQLLSEGQDAAFSRLRAWAKGRAPRPDPRALRRRLLETLEGLGADETQTAAAPADDSDEAISGAISTALPDMLHRMYRGLSENSSLDVINVVLDEQRAELVKALPALIPRLFGLVRGTDGGVLMAGFGLSANRAQVMALEEPLQRQQEQTLNGVQLFCTMLGGKKAIDGVGLLDALLRDLDDLRQRHQKWGEEITAQTRASASR